ncbi:MAG: hypothetical protein BGO97_01495 [Micrococcales bacterium 70-64]|nr:septum formation family protein [Leifsonia sp.]ODU65891.1 MAG: hypothetical protein ABT06_01500 [Leifsonia sp. SCN 70-46]OJX84517.1 MAG: hypothetical protein BGO97_01495 [Micrococcales bacterium 70-64]
MTPRRPALTLLLAVAGLVLAGCSGVGGAAPSPTPTADPGIPVRDLAVGDCIDSHGRPGISETVLVVGCGEEHDSEAYAEIVLDDGGFPGDAAVKDRAQGGCAADFVEFAGIDYESSSLDYAYYYPTPGSWADGDRRILCLILDPAGAVTGTLEGAAR